MVGAHWAHLPHPGFSAVVERIVHVQMAGTLRKEHKLPLTYIALDWHEMDKALGHEGIVEAFWSQVRRRG